MVSLLSILVVVFHGGATMEQPATCRASHHFSRFLTATPYRINSNVSALFINRGENDNLVRKIRSSFCLVHEKLLVYIENTYYWLPLLLHVCYINVPVCIIMNPVLASLKISTYRCQLLLLYFYIYNSQTK